MRGLGGEEGEADLPYLIKLIWAARVSRRGRGGAIQRRGSLEGACRAVATTHEAAMTRKERGMHKVLLQVTHGVNIVGCPLTAGFAMVIRRPSPRRGARWPLVAPRHPLIDSKRKFSLNPPLGDCQGDGTGPSRYIGWMTWTFCPRIRANGHLAIAATQIPPTPTFRGCVPAAPPSRMQ